MGQWHKGLFTGIQLNGARGVIPAPPCDWYASISVGEVAGSRFFYSLNVLREGPPQRRSRKGNPQAQLVGSLSTEELGVEFMKHLECERSAACADASVMNVHILFLAHIIPALNSL